VYYEIHKKKTSGQSNYTKDRTVADTDRKSGEIGANIE